MSKGRKSKKSKSKKLLISIASLMMLLILFLIEVHINKNNIDINSILGIDIIGSNNTNQISYNYSLENIPEYNGKIYVELNNNIPYFEEKDIENDGKEGFERYSELDVKGRCGVAYANICKEIMPKDKQKRESISKVKPTGWIQTTYEGEYLYNRCHLIAFQLADENANEKNLITGTRYFNTEGMLPFENKVANYVKNNKNSHVLYRVTPYYEGDNLLASGVEIEAYSVEDKGEGIKFNVFIYNVQPGLKLDYSTGNTIK